MCITVHHIVGYINGDRKHQFHTDEMTNDWFNLVIKQEEISGSYEYSIYVNNNKEGILMMFQLRQLC